MRHIVGNKQLITCLCALLGLLVIPNAFFWLLGKEIFLSRSLINVDYLLLAAFLIWFPLLIRVLGFTLLCALDFLTAAGPAFHFSYQSMLQSVLDTLNLQPALFLPTALGITVVSAILGYVLSRLINIDSRRHVYSLILILSAFTLHALDDRLSARVLPINFSTSTVGNILRVIIADQRREEAVLALLPPNHPVASDAIWKKLDGNHHELPKNIYLIVVESWGWYREESVNTQLAKLFKALEPDYRVQHGKVPFKGSTVPGELRELCRANFSGVHPPVSAIKDLRCLPELLGSRGYTSRGIHGYSGSMFKRRDWYPALFGDNVEFVDDLDRSLAARSRCGVSFRGICDADLMDFLTDDRHPDVPTFNYLLTLNAHLPVYQPMGAKGDCTSFKTTSTSSQHCFLYQHMVTFFDKVIHFADNQQDSTLIVLVGDHMPPFIQMTDRQHYDEEQVPFVVLERKPESTQ